jgi:hypothetical protein
MSPGPPWKEFEEIVERLQRAFHPGAKIERNVKLTGRDSQRPRQIDISIRQTVGVQEILIIVECKHWSRKIDVKAVEAFAGVKEDVGAHSGMMISTRGFSEGAQNLADKKQISLFTFRDTKKENWPSGLKVPVIVEVWVLKPLALYIKRASGERTVLTSDKELKMCDSKTGKKNNVAELMMTCWQEHEPKQDGDVFWEIPAGEKKDGALADSLGIGFSAKFYRDYREGRLNFQGVVDGKQTAAHMQGFEIETVESPQSISRDEPVFRAGHAGFGVLITTMHVETSDLPSRARQQAILQGQYHLSVKTNSAIRIALSNRPQ